MKSRKFWRLAFWAVLLLVCIGFVMPQNLTMPVVGATQRDYHPKSFWYHPWGRSGTHKGVDIFADKGTSVVASTAGWVVYRGQVAYGGKVAIVLGPKWRLHYYAHLDTIAAKPFSFIRQGMQIGSVGTSGNAHGKAPHLHYAMITMVPYPWRMDQSPQGYKKMFYLNPITYLSGQ